MKNQDVLELIRRLEGISQDIVDGASAVVITQAINCILDQRAAMARAIELINNPDRILPWEGDGEEVLNRALGDKKTCT